MKNHKKVLAMFLGTMMAVSALAGCSSAQTTNGSSASSGSTSASAEQGASASASADEAANTELSGTLKLYGPGLFTDVGPDGNTDIVTGVSRPGYNEVLERWNELYPNV